MKSKFDVFKKEIDLIKNDKIKDFVQKCLENAPDYFFTMPASTTGKYHPEYTLGTGGLVRHTKAAVIIANELLSLEMYAKISESKDEIIAALILHDSVKKGFDGSAYTTTDHPLMASELVKSTSEQNKIDDEFVASIRNLIETHMGQWTKDFKTGNEVLQKPKSVEQKFVHMCDFLASRKFITVHQE